MDRIQTFWLVVVSVVAAINLGFMATHVQSAVFGGGWPPVAAGLTVLAAGIALRTWVNTDPGPAVQVRGGHPG